nr:G-type lectin S-receptor-like serine/threonine-protein kinase At1g11410 [Lolium perenne]
MTKVMVGSERYKSIADMPPGMFVEQVHDNWKERLQGILRAGTVEVHCQQVKTCIEIAMECLRPNRQERPVIKDIVSRLNKTEMSIGHLGVQLQEDFLPRMNVVENKLHHTSLEPWNLSSKMLTDITNNFDEDRILGSGVFGKFYRGVLEDGQVIAVKLLHQTPGIDDSQFENEFNNLKKLKHQNVVQLLGFCNEEEEELVEFQGRLVRAYKRHAAVCLEFMANKSLREFLDVGIRAITIGIDGVNVVIALGSNNQDHGCNQRNHVWLSSDADEE